MPGLDPRAPGPPVRTGPALPRARARSGEHVARKAFELDAARTDAELGIGSLWHGLEVTAFDGTTAELDANDELIAAFGVPAGGKNPLLRLVALVRTATHRWIAAAIGGHCGGEDTPGGQLPRALAPRGPRPWRRPGEAGTQRLATPLVDHGKAPGGEIAVPLAGEWETENSVPPPKKAARRPPPRPARPVRGPRPAGSMGIPARAQHDRRRRGPRRRRRRHRSGPDPVHRRARPGPRRPPR